MFWCGRGCPKRDQPARRHEGHASELFPIYLELESIYLEQIYLELEPIYLELEPVCLEQLHRLKL